ncbi:MAG: type II toxin-antitoxin system VapC family toxin [Kiritimatiellia bacterium]
MNVFLDTSVVLRRLLNEPHPVSRWGKWEAAYASRLWLTEAFRTVDRLRLEGRLVDRDVARVCEDLRRVDDTLHLVPVDEAVLARAGEAFPTALGTLDAIHLATALAVRSRLKLDRFLTHDRQLALAAVSMGFSVEGA